MKTRQSGLSKREQVKSIVSRAKQRSNRFSDDGHPLHPSKIAVSGDIFYPDNLNAAANKHKRDFPEMVENIRDDRKKDFKKVDPKPQKRGQSKKAMGGRIEYKAGSTGCKLAMKGKGRAYGKNS
jgi:hypothetical protein